MVVIILMNVKVEKCLSFNNILMVLIILMTV